MKTAEYDTMREIAQELDVCNVEQIEGFAADCKMLGFKRTSRYIVNCVRNLTDPLKDLIMVKLVEDLSGCY